VKSHKSLILLILFLAGCANAGSATATGTVEPTATVPQPVLTPTPVALAVVDGEQIYRTRCASCHGLDDRESSAMGLGGLFAMESFSDGQPFSEEALGGLILQGTGVGVSAMPASRIDAAELAALIAYLREATR
jgi:mono/diheme cytochrome c family protein